MKFLLYCAFVVCIGFVYAEEVTIYPCSEDEVKHCSIDAVRITPCKESLKEPPQPCKFKKQKTADIEVDFTPGFATDTMHCQMYWPNGFLDLPLADMETNGCKTTTCPSVANVKQTYTYSLKIAQYFPLSTYDVKWILKGSDSDTMKCCFIFKIKISK